VRNSLGGPAMDTLRLQPLDSSRDELHGIKLMINEKEKQNAEVSIPTR
jgi:hypothetical protein